MFNVSGSTSMNTGVAPVYIVENGEAIMVKFGSITSSPSLMFTVRCAT